MRLATPARPLDEEAAAFAARRTNGKVRSDDLLLREIVMRLAPAPLRLGDRD